jgi:hypothetical protein
LSYEFFFYCCSDKLPEEVLENLIRSCMIYKVNHLLSGTSVSSYESQGIITPAYPWYGKQMPQGSPQKELWHQLQLGVSKKAECDLQTLLMGKTKELNRGQALCGLL